MRVFSFFSALMLAVANGLSCAEYKSAYDEAMHSVCDKTWKLEYRKGTTGLACQRELKKAKQWYFKCLNGNLDEAQKKVQSGHEDGSPCVKFGDTTILQDPELNIATRDIVLWSGLTEEEQMGFKPWKLVNTGKHPMILGRSWVSDLLVTLGEKAKFSAEQWEECMSTSADYLSDESEVPTDASAYCKDPCRWHRDMTIKPWEGMSKALVKSFYNISESDTKRNEIYVLLNKWREDGVFAKTELVTFLQEEMKKHLSANLNHKAGTLDIRVRKNAGAEKTSDEFDSKTMVKVNGVVRYRATCEKIVKFVLDEQERELKKNAFTGYKIVCVKCYEDCGGDFKTVREGEDKSGSCTLMKSDGCSSGKQEL